MISKNEILVTVDGNPVELGTNSLSIVEQVDQRATCSFEIVDVTGGMVLFKGQRVEVFIDGSRRFSGIILSGNIIRVTIQGDRHIQVKSSGGHYSADKRLVAASFESMTAGDIVLNLWQNYLQDEGVKLAYLYTGGSTGFDMVTRLTAVATGRFVMVSDFVMTTQLTANGAMLYSDSWYILGLGKTWEELGTENTWDTLSQ